MSLHSIGKQRPNIRISAIKQIHLSREAQAMTAAAAQAQIRTRATLLTTPPPRRTFETRSNHFVKSCTDAESVWVHGERHAIISIPKPYQRRQYFI